MAFDTPLNDRQVDVLRWISDGCPDGRWTDFSFKTTAAALVSRRLVTVSKRRGVWSAGILAAGQHYLTSGQYPPGHWATKRRERPVDRETPVSPSAVARRPVAPRRNEATAPKSTTQPPSPARELVAQVIAAGGELQRESKDGLRAYTLLVAAVNRHHLAPEGKQLTVEMGSPWGIVMIKLEDAPCWLTTPASEVVEAGRIGRWHPALARLREGDFMSMSAPSERRMLRILHALATEASARGHRVEPTSPGRRYHHRQSAAGHIAIRIRGYRYPRRLAEIPRGPATAVGEGTETPGSRSREFPCRWPDVGIGRPVRHQ